eukprot:g43298.t1
MSAVRFDTVEGITLILKLNDFCQDDWDFLLQDSSGWPCISRLLLFRFYLGIDHLASEILSPLAQMEEERREHVAKMKKMEMEMEQVFEMKVKEKIQKLKDSEAELQRRHEQMKKNLEAQHKELEEKRRQFEDEKQNWEAQQRILEQQKLDSTRLLKEKQITNGFIDLYIADRKICCPVMGQGVNFCYKVLFAPVVPCLVLEPAAVLAAFDHEYKKGRLLFTLGYLE